MDSQAQHKFENQNASSSSSTRPRVLVIVDLPNWAHDLKTNSLMRTLGDDYHLKKRYQSEATAGDFDWAHLVLVLHLFQFEDMPHLEQVLERHRGKLLLGVCSHAELEGSRGAAGVAILRTLARGIFANNLRLYAQCKSLFSAPVFYTPNGVDTEFYRNVPRPEHAPVMRVGWAGSLLNHGPDHRGYYDFIVPAVKSVSEVELVTAAREDKWRGPEEMREFYQSLDVYICASRSEGTPNTCLEAAACGVPLLTTRVGNMPELVRDKVNGFFIERDVSDIASKLRLLRDDRALCALMGQRIHRDIQSWDWSIRSRAYQQMFEHVLGQKRATTSKIVLSSTDRAAIVSRNRRGKRSWRPPVARLSQRSDFRVVALVSAYNEEDIIVSSLRYLINQGLKVYLIDNWSTDSTSELASQFLGKGLLAIEKFPKEGPPRYYLWRDILTRMEDLTKEIDADWFLVQDVDEIKVSPWPGLSLRDAILRVDLEGFNCIDHTVASFHPVDNDFTPGTDFETYFKYFEFSNEPSYFTEINGWKNSRETVSLVESGGHEVRFDGRRVYPYRFLLKHYPVRSQRHGEKKIFKERKPRWLPEEKAIGWHCHYDHVNEGHFFLHRPHDLQLFDQAGFNCTTVGNGPPIIDWVREHIQAMMVKPDKAFALVNLEFAKRDEAIQSLSAKVNEKDQALNTVTAELVSKNSELESTKAAIERSSKQLAEMGEKVLALVDHVAERQGAVESLTTQLCERHEKVLALVDLVAERQRAVDLLAAELGESEKRVSVLTAEAVARKAELKTITRTFRERLLRLYGKLKYLYLLPFYRLLGVAPHEK